MTIEEKLRKVHGPIHGCRYDCDDMGRLRSAVALAYEDAAELADLEWNEPDLARAIRAKAAALRGGR